MSFQKRFREIRESLGLTQQEMASRLHKQQPDISKIENGEKELTISEMNELRSTFHLADEVLFYLSYGIKLDEQSSLMMIKESYEDAETKRLLDYLSDHPSFKKLLTRFTYLPDKNQQYIEQILITLVNMEEKRK
ncbi:helix-turn-helix transcriptional regulator [Bacillus sp. FJAT-49736]|uniref:helix-turn-helix transcriptional regulator n=1 Tax=Bacillus sp. FJAT-49736 TaxID=2833582 RepID=UPI001BC9FF65|nr:helix-turn-helix transcriptional regulator [Bacillus sp. FJAT-49736]MBS4174582.1 helix-turn-helix transcriptional regulator [Bacillus sp. FJAT-49736]